MGKWQCPNCCQKGDLLEPASHLDSISKRARTKIVNTKAKSGIKLSERDKMSQIFGNSIVAKKRSSSKGKSVLTHGMRSFEKKLDSSQIDISCSAKSSHSPVGCSIDDVNVGVERESEMSPTHCMDKKSISPDKEVSSPSNVAISDAKDEASEACASPEVKPVLSSNNVSQGNTIVLAISATTKEARKRKYRANNDKGQKKRRIDKGKGAVSVCKQLGSKANTASPESSKSQRKHKSVNSRVSASLSKEDIGIKNSDVQSKDEVSTCYIVVACFCPNFICR